MKPPKPVGLEVAPGCSKSTPAPTLLGAVHYWHGKAEEWHLAASRAERWRFIAAGSLLVNWAGIVSLIVWWCS